MLKLLNTPIVGDESVIFVKCESGHVVNAELRYKNSEKPIDVDKSATGIQIPDGRPGIPIDFTEIAPTLPLGQIKIRCETCNKEVVYEIMKAVPDDYEEKLLQNLVAQFRKELEELPAKVLQEIQVLADRIVNEIKEFLKASSPVKKFKEGFKRCEERGQAWLDKKMGRKNEENDRVEIGTVSLEGEKDDK